MSKKYVITFALGFIAMIGWNMFLIQRDERLYDAYYRQQAIDNLKRPPSTEIRSFTFSSSQQHLDGSLLSYSPNTLITWTNTMIPKRIKDLIKKAEMDKAAEDFWKEVEAEAAKKEVTVDYYLAEFY